MGRKENSPAYCSVTVGNTSRSLSAHPTMPFTDDPRAAQSGFDIILPVFIEKRSNSSGITFSLSSIKEILEDHRIIKVGIEVKCDADYLFNDYGVRVATTLDLRYMAEITGHHPGGLKKLSENCINVKLNKNDKRIHLLWESPTLQPKQITYAANDAHVGIELFKFFANKLQQTSPIDCQTYVDCIMRNFSCKKLNKKYKQKPKPKQTSSADPWQMIKNEDEGRSWLQVLKL